MVTYVFLALIGERRFDVYLSTSILSYFIAFLFEPNATDILSRTGARVLSAIFLALFILSAAIRVLRILYPEIEFGGPIEVLYGGD